MVEHLSEDDVGIKLEENETLKALDLRVIVKLFDVPNKTSGGIFLPDTVRDANRKKQIVAEVVSTGGSVGQGWENKAEREEIRPGAKVLVGRYAGQEVKPAWLGLPPGEYRIINDGDIAGVFLKKK